MADILIMGIEMPKNGRITIQIGSDGAIYTVDDCKITKEKYEKDYILLEVPPHGDLIDRDALMQQIEHDTPLSAVFEKTMRRYLHNAPTVIPASKEAE